jgi:hypothetical protein
MVNLPDNSLAVTANDNNKINHSGSFVTQSQIDISKL